MQKIIALFLLMVGLALCSSTTIQACTCDDLPNHKKDFKSAWAVFVGRVVSIDEPLPLPQEDGGSVAEVAYAVNFEIEKSWKGATSGTIQVFLHLSSVNCSSWKFRPNERYLVYARLFQDVLIVNTWCTRTRPLERNDPESVKEYKELAKMAGKRPVSRVANSDYYSSTLTLKEKELIDKLLARLAEDPSLRATIDTEGEGRPIGQPSLMYEVRKYMITKYDKYPERVGIVQLYRLRSRLELFVEKDGQRIPFP